MEAFHGRLTRGSLAVQESRLGKVEAKQHLRDSLAALATYDPQRSLPENATVLFEVGKGFHAFVKALYKQAGVAKNENDMNLLIKQLQKWTPPTSPDEIAHKEKVVGKRTAAERGGPSLGEIKGKEELCRAFPQWIWDFDIPAKANDIRWQSRGLKGSLDLDVEKIGEETVALLADVTLRFLYLAELYMFYGDSSQNIMGCDERKLYMHVCTLLTAIAAFSSKERLVGDSIPEDPQHLAEQNVMDAFEALLLEPEMIVSHEQWVTGKQTKGRTECAVLRVHTAKGPSATRHEGNAEVKKNLKTEWGGFFQCIGGVSAQLEENWRLDDEAEATIDVQKRRKSDGDSGAASSSAGLTRSSSSSSLLQEDEVVPRFGRGFGFPTDWERWLGVLVIANRQKDGTVRAKVRCSGEAYWRKTGPDGMIGLLRLIVALMLPEMCEQPYEVWAERAQAMEQHMAENSLSVLQRCGLLSTKRAELLKANVNEITRLRSENESLKEEIMRLKRGGT